MSIIPQLKQADINLPSDSNICFPFIHSQEDVVEYISENEKVKKKEKKKSWDPGNGKTNMEERGREFFKLMIKWRPRTRALQLAKCVRWC